MRGYQGLIGTIGLAGALVAGAIVASPLESLAQESRPIVAESPADNSARETHTVWIAHYAVKGNGSLRLDEVEKRVPKEFYVICADEGYAIGSVGHATMPDLTHVPASGVEEVDTTLASIVREHGYLGCTLILTNAGEGRLKGRLRVTHYDANGRAGENVTVKLKEGEQRSVGMDGAFVLRKNGA